MSVHAGIHSGLIHNHGDLVGVLRNHARVRPDQVAYRFLREGQSDAILTYSQLDGRARAIAARLTEMGFAGRRVLLAYPHGLDFISGFFGCFYAGCTAVPTYLPHRRTQDRFFGIAADAGASVAMSTVSTIVRLMDSSGLRMDAAASMVWLASDDIADESAAGWRMPDIGPDNLAMLQFTSGSTSQPKGVMLSHGNLIDNARAIHDAFGIGQEAGVFWLPACHDMGLVGGVLVPMLAGAASTLMSPASFLQRPVAWLEAISKHSATISGGPNFAYDLCARRITAEQRSTLDLSSWSLAFVGAEPVSPATLERFAQVFEPCGFNPAAFYPCYGLAEATLMVTGIVRGGGPTVRGFCDTALARNSVVPASSDENLTRRFVSCGAPVGDARIVIVDPESSAKVVPGHVGEIWVSGASVGQGYWQKPTQTRASFLANLSDTGEGPFLRTGDVGFLFEGELYVIGRLDDLLIVRGLNHHPQDLETTARESHPLLEAGLGAAFAVEHPAGQRLILVHEVTRNWEMQFTPVLDAVRKAVIEEHGVSLHSIVLVRCGTIPKTSSGKVQRRACRSALLAGTLHSLAAFHSQATPTVAAMDAHDAILSTHTGPPSADSSVFATVCQHALAFGGAALSGITPDTPLTALGLDSLQRVELAAALERAFTCRLPDKEFNPEQTLGELARAVQASARASSAIGLRAVRIAVAHHDIARFPEYVELKRYERMLKAVAGDHPYFRVDEGGTGCTSVARIAGRDVLNFGVYDYIGLSRHPDVVSAAKAAIDRYGTSSGASRLVSGEKQVHQDLERAIADFLETPAAIVFVSGHATNVTTIGHLLGPEDLIVHDALAHNSIIQGAQLSGATRRAFPHNDWQALDSMLTEVRHRYRRVLIAIEGVYSMDGDFPNLPRFVELKNDHKALILVDEAHSLGTMGSTGRGIGEHWGVARRDVDLWMGTLSKTLGSCGGYVAGSAELIELLRYTAPGFVYSVGLAPSNAAAALAALTVLRAEPHRVTRLHELSALFLREATRRGLNTGLAAGTPVIPVIVGSSVKSLRLAGALHRRGINVQPILHPAVPEHSSRFRFFVTANHNEVQIRDTVRIFADELATL